MALRDVFLIKEVHDQHWTSNGKRYNVFQLYDWAREQGYQPVEISVGSLTKGFDKTNLDEPKWSEAFVQRARESGRDPILVVDDEDGDRWIADGNHRYGRAVIDGDETIMGYVLYEPDLPEDAIEPK